MADTSFFPEWRQRLAPMGRRTAETWPHLRQCTLAQLEARLSERRTMGGTAPGNYRARPPSPGLAPWLSHSSVDVGDPFAESAQICGARSGWGLFAPLAFGALLGRFEDHPGNGYPALPQPGNGEKKLLALLIAHNALRWLMCQTAHEHGVALDRISFTGAKDACRHFATAIAQAKTAKKRR
jgi:hypothetical protein